jgi:hypothetical protein
MDSLDLLGHSRSRYPHLAHPNKVLMLIVGMGLLINLGYPYNTAKSVVYLLITGIGIGGLFQTPLIALQAAMPSRDMAVATGAMVLFRLLGSATGVAMGGTILDNQLASRLAGITGQSFTFNLEDVNSLSSLPQPTQSEVLSAFASYLPHARPHPAPTPRLSRPSFRLGGLTWIGALIRFGL